MNVVILISLLITAISMLLSIALVLAHSIQITRGELGSAEKLLDILQVCLFTGLLAFFVFVVTVGIAPLLSV